MGHFDRLSEGLDFSDYFDPEYDQYAEQDENPYGSLAEPFKAEGDPEIKREVLRRLVPETQGYAERFVKGAVGDVRDLASSFAALIGQAVFHPIESAEAVGGALLDPVGTGKMLAEPFIENYTPQDDESVAGMLARNVIDHPFRTLMDAASVLGGAGLVAKGTGAVARGVGAVEAGKAASALGTRAFETAAAIDPIQFSIDRGVKLARTHVPGYAERLDARNALDAIQNERRLHADAANARFQEQLEGPGGVFTELSPTDRAIFHQYAEGRVQLTKPAPDGSGELVPFDPEQYGRMETARQRYATLLEEREKALGYDPETIAQEAGHNAVAKLGDDVDPADPMAQATFEQAYQAAYEQAQEGQMMRRTVSVRTQLTEAKQIEWEGEVNRIRAENDAQGIADEKFTLPAQPSPASVEEAMAHMAEQGGLYFPHSGEVLTKDQATIGNILSKRREALPYKMNTGAMYRSGLLEGSEEAARPLAEGGGVIRYADPSKILLRHFQKIEDSGNFVKLLEDFGARVGKKVPPNHSVGTDAELFDGTKQLLWPNGRVQYYRLQEEAEKLYEALAEHAGDPAVANTNLYEAVEKMVEKMDSTIAVKRGSAYKIPTEAGHELKRLMESYQPPTSLAVRSLDAMGDAWRFTTLPLRPMWVANNVIGNTVFNAMYGLHPLNPAGMSAYFDGFRALTSRKFGWFGEEGAKLADVYKLPGVTAAGLYGTEAVSRTGETLARLEDKLGKLGKIGPGHFAEAVTSFNQGVEDFFRSSATIYGLKQSQKRTMRESGKGFIESMRIGDRISELAKSGTDAIDDLDYRGALAQTNKFLNDYSQQSVFQRQVLRRAMPFQSFYRHAIGLALAQPFERPVQTALIRSVGRVARDHVKDQLETWGFDWERDVPEWMRDSIPVALSQAPNGDSVVQMVSTKGPNPFSTLTSLDPGVEALTSLNPIVKVALETAFGIDLFKMEPVRGPLTTFTGKEVDAAGNVVDATHRVNVLENLARQFWPYQELRKLLARGREPYATSTLLDQLTNAPGTYRRESKTGLERRRPVPGMLRGLAEGPIIPTTQFVQKPTKEQEAGRKRVYSDELNRLGRLYPDLRDDIERLTAELERDRHFSRLRP